MAQVKSLASRLYSAGKRLFRSRFSLFAIGGILLLILTSTIAVYLSHKSTPNYNGIIGRGAGDPFWAEIANKSQAGGAMSAIAWAKSFEAGHLNSGLSERYKGLCLEFVANAYGSAYSTPYDTAWDLARASKLNDTHNLTTAPKGALMFFDLTSHNIPEGHVGISLGGGAMISALEHSPIVQVTPNI